nr:hypothetical protein [Halopiger djelfimassiliensis]
MSTRTPPHADAEPTPNRPETRGRTPSKTTLPVQSPRDPQSATDRAPQTFARRDRTRLENLIDEWNAAFANHGSGRRS